MEDFCGTRTLFAFSPLVALEVRDLCVSVEVGAVVSFERPYGCSAFVGVSGLVLFLFSSSAFFSFCGSVFAVSGSNSSTRFS